MLEQLIDFGAVLRADGLRVHTGRLIDVAHALQQIDLGSRDEVFHTCRTLLVHRHEDFGTFERAFEAFFADAGATRATRATGAESANDAQGALGAPAAPDAPDAPAAPDALDAPDALVAPVAPAILAIWSDTDTIATKDFAALTEAELAMARAAIANLTWNAGVRRTRRWIPGRGSRIDLRKALARSLRTGGEVLQLPRRQRRIKPRPLVLLCDVSGSMERYSRTLLHFAHTLARDTRRVEAFLFATRLTRITMELRTPSADAAIAAAARSVQDWSGGTRIGAALRTFHQRWGRRSLLGGPVVLLISDGWDRGEPQVLRDEIARLQRSCHRLIWLNPLIGTVDFAPLTRGLQAALPFVDDFLPVRTLRDVGDLARHLTSLQGRG
jgi:uncharacterized protein with von Willebrand factor type A (vWA) domain